MRLRPLHRDELFDIAKRGSATVLAVVLFWGFTAPATFFDKPEDIPRIGRYGVAMTSIVVAGCFWSSYRNLLTPELSEKERKLGFVLFWTVGSFCCDFVWMVFLSDYHAVLFAGARMQLENIFDLASTASMRRMITRMSHFHYLVENLLVTFAMGRYRHASSEVEYREALFWFFALGAFQCCSFLQSIFLFVQMYGLKGSWPEPDNALDQCILWSVRLFPVLGSWTCARFSYQLLFDKGEGQVRRQEQESKARDL